MDTVSGRVPSGTGLSQAEPQEGLGPTGFDPSREMDDFVANVIDELIAETRGKIERGESLSLQDQINMLDQLSKDRKRADFLRAELARATGRQRIALIDQGGNTVGHRHAAMGELLREEVFIDGEGTVWTAPTAWAYFAACRAGS